MNLEEINRMWAEDAQLGDDVFEEAKRVSVLHQRYYIIYVKEVLKLKDLRTKLSELKVLKTEYYQGNLDTETMREKGWLPYNLKVLKTDIPSYLEADRDVIQLNMQIAMADVKTKYLEEIIKQINSRNYILSSMVAWAKFKTGAG